MCFFLCDWRDDTSATDVSDQGGCSCVQNISVTLCEENIRYVLGSFRDWFWGYWTLVKYIILGMHHRVILSRAVSFLYSTLSFLPILVSLRLLTLFSISGSCLWFLSLVSVSCFCLLFLTLVSVSYFCL